MTDALPIRPNPLLADHHDPVVDPAAIRRGHVKLVRKARREIRDARRCRNAADVIADLDQNGTEIFGLTRGQFSMVDLLEATIAKTGPVDLAVATWAAATIDIGKITGMVADGTISRARWILDASFVRRCPALAAQIRATCGPEAIRVTRVHAKFALLTNATWRVCCRTSMNLNANPRLEHFTIGHDPELAAFLQMVLADLWANQPSRIADNSFTDFTRWWHDQAQ